MAEIFEIAYGKSLEWRRRRWRRADGDVELYLPNTSEIVNLQHSA
jgi:hypothetical protein